MLCISSIWTRGGVDRSTRRGTRIAGGADRDHLALLGDAEVTSLVTQAGSDSTANESDRTATYAHVRPADGRRYSIIRSQARRGIGAVYLALDGELHREVALKPMLDGHADDPASRRRFLQEAEVTGGLEHPGIVPVYGLGHFDDGRPYYVMSFIRGESLNEVVEAFYADAAQKADVGERSLALRKLLRKFIDVCNAIDYAHGRGVLHRDIKPRNIILGEHGETLVVDWRLPKLDFVRVSGRSIPR